MSAINSRGQVCHGTGGGWASIDNVAFHHGGVAGWVDDDTVLFANGDDPFPAAHPTDWAASTYHVPTQTTARVLGETGMNVGHTSNAGQWALWWGTPNPNGGLWTSAGLHLPIAGLLGMGPDGSMAYKASSQTNGPTLVRETSGEEWQLTPNHAYALQLLGQRRAVFVDSALGLTFYGIPTPLVLMPGGGSGHRAVWVNNGWWIAYYADRRAQVVVHPFNELVGYAVSRPGDAWFNVRALSDTVLYVPWSGREGEQPGEMVLGAAVTFDVATAPRVPLFVPPDKPPDPPVPGPTPPPRPVIRVQSYDALLKAGVAWSLEFTDQGSQTAFTIRKNDRDELWIEALNGAGHAQTATRRVRVEGPTTVAATASSARVRVGTVGIDELAVTPGQAPPWLTVTLVDTLIKAGVPWHLDFTNTGDDTAYLVSKDEHDQLWIDARNGGGRDQTGLVRQLTVEGPDAPPEPPDPGPPLEGGIMLSSYADPAAGVIAVKTIKPVPGTSLATLIMPNDQVVSCQPGGTLEARDPGTDGAWERCRAGANVATYSPEPGTYYSFPFVEVAGL